jgi:hypothetical protein
MSTKEGVEEVKKLKGDGWIFAGGNFDNHEEYFDKFITDWKQSCSVFFDPPRGVHLGKNNVPLTTCICNEVIKRWIFIYHPDKEEWGCIGSSCLKFIEKQKMCGATGCRNIHNNRRQQGVIDNRCDECRQKVKDKKKLICPKCGGKKGAQYRKCYGCRAPRTGWYSY